METNLSIGQAAKILNCNESMLRFYESEFSLCVPRTDSNRRIYSKEDIERLKLINSLRQQGYSIKQIKQRFDTGSEAEDGYSFEQNELWTAAPAQTAELNELYELIKLLRQDINALKGSSDLDAGQLAEENEKLKQKLKEKTYEIVELREELNYLKSGGSKKKYKMKF